MYSRLTRRLKLVRMVITAVVLAAALFSFPAIQASPKAHAATVDPTLAQATLVNINNLPIANAGATVYMLPNGTDLGVTDVQQTVVGSGTTDTQGHVQSTFDPYLKGPGGGLMLPAGYVNYELLLTDKDGNTLSDLYFWRWYQSPLAQGPAPAQGSCNGLPYDGGDPTACIASDDSLASISSNSLAASVSPMTLTADTLITDGGVTPGLPIPPTFYYKTVATTVGPVIVGDLHVVPDLVGSFTYGKTANTNVTVSVSGDGTHWSANGSVHVGDTNGSTATWPNEKGAWGYQLATKFVFVKQQRYMNPGGVPTNSYRILTTDWSGDAGLGSDVSRFDNHPNQWKITIRANGGKFSRDAGNGYTYGMGACAFGVCMNTETDYSTTSHYEWTNTSSTKNHYLYGNNNFPTLSTLIYASSN